MIDEKTEFVFLSLIETNQLTFTVIVKSSLAYRHFSPVNLQLIIGVRLRIAFV